MILLSSIFSILLSFQQQTPLISFVSSLFLPRSSCSSPSLVPFINPSSFLPLFPVASLFSSACRSYLFFRIPPYSRFLHRHPRSPFSFFILSSVPTLSSFLLFLSQSSFIGLLLFPSFLFFLFIFFLFHIILRTSSLSLLLFCASSILFCPLLASFFLPFSSAFFILYFVYFLYFSILFCFLLSFLLYTHWLMKYGTLS